MKSKLMFAAITGLVVASSAGAAEKAKSTEPTTTMGECHGVNECKGTGQCATQTHSCAGANACKGQGWISMTEKDCTTKKGKWKKTAGMMHGHSKPETSAPKK
jgi:hypothetical protein